MSLAAGKMGVKEFGDALITTLDLDPVYVGLVGARLPEPQMCRWLLAYWCFYHVGAASWLSELDGDNFWWNMRNAAENKIAPRTISDQLPTDRWPRASERRHFRGDKCVQAVEWLRDAGAPEDPVRFLAAASTDKQVMSIVQGWPMFGPWIAFKAADMMERVYGTPIKFDPNLGLMYEEPRKALRLLIDLPGSRYNTEADAYAQLLTYFGRLRAPPIPEGTNGTRVCGPQEVETVLCKWKSHLGGHYHVGKDIAEQRAALAGWGETAQRVLSAYPKEVQ